MATGAASRQTRKPVPAAPRAAAAPVPGDGYVQSFARGIAVIRTFSAAAPRQTLSEVAAAAGLTRAGARRILLTLHVLGYVETDGKHYALTARILDLGFAYLSSMPMWNRAEPIVETLVEQVHESSSAAVLDGSDIVYVLRVPTHKIMSINLGVGSRLPAPWTSMGRVLLGALPADELEARLAAASPPPATRHTVTDAAGLRARIAQARKQGWCIVNQELEEGLVSIACPITDRSGRTVAALNVSGQANRTSARAMQDGVLPALQAAAQAISRRLAGAA